MGQDVSAYETLNVLTLEGRLENCGLKQDIVREDPPYKKLMTGNVGGRRGVDVGDPNGVETQLGSQALPNDTASCPCVNHGDCWDGRGDRGAGFLKSGLDGCPDGDSKFDYRANCL